VKHPVTPDGRYFIVRGGCGGWRTRRSMKPGEPISLAARRAVHGARNETRSFPTREDLELAKAAIFDMDGTLLISVDLHAVAWQEALSASKAGKRTDGKVAL
jgi:hypothetical protein